MFSRLGKCYSSRPSVTSSRPPVAGDSQSERGSYQLPAKHLELLSRQGIDSTARFLRLFTSQHSLIACLCLSFCSSLPITQSGLLNCQLASTELSTDNGASHRTTEALFKVSLSSRQCESIASLFTCSWLNVALEDSS